MRRLGSRIGLLCFWGGALVACGDGSNDVVEETSSEGEETGDSDEVGTDGTDEGADDGADGDDGDTGADPLGFASGIRILRLTANQATQVQLVEEGLALDGPDYNTRLIRGRTTLIRAFWSLHAGFEPRELVGQLTLERPDGEVLVQENTFMVEGESSDGNASSFQWLLDPEWVVPGAQYRVRILEPDPAVASGEVSDPPPILPLPGKGTLDVYDAPLEMRVVIVPIAHEMDECPDGVDGVQTPMPTEEDLEVMAQNLEQNNAVQQAIVTLREPMPYTDPIGTSGEGFSPVLSALAQTRAADNPDPNVYYYGILDPCDGFPPGLLGQAISIPGSPTMEAANERISTGRWLGDGEATSETFVHEVGHSQGRRHVTCSGGEAGPDPAYPHPNGRIGVWGFGIYDHNLRSPSGAKDYMTYCANEWVSDYAWEQTLEVIEVLTSWDYDDVEPPTTGNVLMGAIYPTGRQEWWTAPGAVAAERLSPATAVRFDYGDTSLEVPAFAERRPDSDTIQVIANLPSDFDAVEAITADVPGVTALAVTEVRRFDR